MDTPAQENGRNLRRSSKLTRQRSLKVTQAWITDLGLGREEDLELETLAPCGEAVRPRRSSHQDSVLQLGAPHGEARRPEARLSSRQLSGHV